MNARYILDTDHVSLYQRRHPQVVARLLAMPHADLFVTTITLGEQIQGRLAVIRQARTQSDAARGYVRLRETVEFYQSVQLVDYTTDAVVHFETLRREGIRIGTQDLRIAAIALAEGAILVSRNTRDFVQVPGLALEDWAS
ncbi:MAG: type II toxin-antitoxin system VapC family toxin [Candidatus Viridilinea halotolerans]|uniref:Type II toxin-antitoxin system VapC family toxin n=1 Tax=Candidatus Viridilinea halotolerans TaxID=2491704 RepID=A0A426U7L5_9CHLR|nr:MAG: type II toxin-antitoxin system VapC family toxin [Candidatus Viridilinea halotolerans]